MQQHSHHRLEKNIDHQSALAMLRLAITGRPSNSVLNLLSQFRNKMGI